MLPQGVCIVLSLAIFHSILHRLVFRGKVQTNTVNTVPLIGWRWISFALEDVAEMSTTIGAANLSS